jgi:hypothetical protein
MFFEQIVLAAGAMECCRQLLVIAAEPIDPQMTSIAPDLGLSNR